VSVKETTKNHKRDHTTL